MSLIWPATGIAMGVLLLYGIKLWPGIAVATQASHITASSVSGALAQWRRGGVDLKMGLVLMAGGLIGSYAGVALFGLLRELGQVEFVVTASYVVLLGSIGGLMLNESVRTIRARIDGGEVVGGLRAQDLHVALAVRDVPSRLKFADSPVDRTRRGNITICEKFLDAFGFKLEINFPVSVERRNFRGEGE